MAPKREEIVITGVGVVCPIGIGKKAFWASISEGRTGVRCLDLFQCDDLPAPFGAVVADFDPKQFVRPRKSLKVMSRDIQLGFAAADLAIADAGIHQRPVDPERLGIVYGADLIRCELDELTDAYRGCMANGRFDFDRWGEQAMAEMFPLWILKYLPNMPACHIGIAQDARGPNNSITLGDVSSLSALSEAMRVIDRGHAEVMIAGGTGSRIHPTFWVRAEVLHLSHRADDPAAASRPFDARRDGTVNGEGAAAFILESRRHAEARGATIYARILGCAGAFEPCRNGAALQGKAIRRAIEGALHDAGASPEEVGHVNAHGSSTVFDDRMEALAIRHTLGDVPVTAPKSFFGNLGAGSGAVEMAASVLGLSSGVVPQTLNYRYADPYCPVNVVGRGPIEATRPAAVILNHASSGQAVAMLLGGPE